MALFDKTATIDVDDVSAIAQSRWGAKLGKLIKASQNHTFEATLESDETIKLVVRVTPDPQGIHRNRIASEVQFVDFIASSGELSYICAPIRSVQGDLFVVEKGLILVVSNWAIGAPLDFMAYRWMTDQSIVYNWGQWLAQFHHLSRRFSAAHPDVARSVQRWDEMHHGILKGSVIHPDDEAVVQDPQHYGVLHGDLNVSNFFIVEGVGGLTLPTLSVFDWDQTQQGWYLWDVAQSMLTVNMLHEGGSVVDGSPVPSADPVQFETWMVDGYESVAGVGSVDRVRLTRMLKLRKSFYECFCRKAQEQGDIPKDMEHFINYVVAWFDKVKD
eukprot:gene29224-33006_t